ncbi:hypothetical protein MRX96_047634 [Rhipicephalus microplus]
MDASDPSQGFCVPQSTLWSCDYSVGPKTIELHPTNYSLNIKVQTVLLHTENITKIGKGLYGDYYLLGADPNCFVMGHSRK